MNATRLAPRTIAVLAVVLGWVLCNAARAQSTEAPPRTEPGGLDFEVKAYDLAILQNGESYLGSVDELIGSVLTMRTLAGRKLSLDQQDLASVVFSAGSPSAVPGLARATERGQGLIFLRTGAIHFATVEAVTARHVLSSEASFDREQVYQIVFPAAESLSTPAEGTVRLSPGSRPVAVQGSEAAQLGVCWRGEIEAEQQTWSILGTRQSWTVSLDAVFKALTPSGPRGTEFDFQWANYTVVLEETGRKHSFSPNPYRASGILTPVAQRPDRVSAEGMPEGLASGEAPKDTQYSLTTVVLDPQKDDWPLRTVQHQSSHEGEAFVEVGQHPLLPDSLQRFWLHGEIEAAVTRMRGEDALSADGGTLRWDLRRMPACPASPLAARLVASHAVETPELVPVREPELELEPERQVCGADVTTVADHAYADEMSSAMMGLTRFRGQVSTCGSLPCPFCVLDRFPRGFGGEVPGLSREVPGLYR